MSNDPLPQNIQYCIDSWKRNLPEYKIVKWDLNRFPLDKSIWVKEAFEQKKYAFAADYIRLYALATEGGIYLDSDVEVIKPFDDLLNLPYFICNENSPQGLEAATIGAEKGTPWICKCLEQYNEKHFIEKDGSFNTSVLPSILKNCIVNNFKVQEINHPSEFNINPEIVCILPADYFSPKNYVTKKIKITKNTYSIHHFAGTWQPLWKKIILRIWVPFSVKYPKLANKIKNIIN
mgnify:CR=1 FL=1